MIEFHDARGFQHVNHDGYDVKRSRGARRLVQQSNVFDQPASSFLWVGEHHHLSRVEVAALRDYLTRWLETGYLFDAKPDSKE